MILANTSHTYHSGKICLHHLGGRDHSPCNDIGLFLRQIAHKLSRNTEKKDTSKLANLLATNLFTNVIFVKKVGILSSIFPHTYQLNY